MKITILRDVCIGCGVCADLSPGVFEMDGENIAVVNRDPGPEEVDSVREAAESCPVDAIDIGE
ncbi:MAG TPA: ferredoxin [bacterium]|nr:ferredoxin [bacterium]